MAGGNSNTPIPSGPEGSAGAAPAERADAVVHGTYDPVSGRSDWSDDACRVLGISADRLPRTREECLALVHPEDRALVVAHVETDVAARRPSELDCRIVVGGRTRTIRCRVAVQRAPDSGCVVRVFWTFRDITDNRHLDGVLHHADALLALVVERCREIIFIRDAATGRLIYCSPALATVADIPVERMPATREEFLQLVHPDDREHIRTRYREVLDGPVNLEWRLVRSDGQVRWMSSRLVPLRDGNDVTRVAGISEDVTDRHAAEEDERRHHDELTLAVGRSAMWELATALAHEIQQPLFSIRTFARSCVRRLEDGTADLEDVRNTCERIAAEAERSAEVVAHLRDIVRGRPPATRPEDLNALVAEVLRLAGPETLTPTVAVDLVPDAAGPIVQADRAGVQQVLLNLIRNAVEAMTDVAGPRRLSIAIGTDGIEASVSLADDGCGLDPESMDRMFEPFFTTKPDGTGMGLAICRTIVEAHGGRLRAAPRDGGGAVFTFTLPVAAPPGDGNG